MFCFPKEEKKMKTLKKITNFVSKYMAVIVIVVAALALFAPNTVSFIKTSYVNTLLGIVMFGMGLTLKPNDFKVVFSRPKDVIIGSCRACNRSYPCRNLPGRYFIQRYDLSVKR